MMSANETDLFNENVGWYIIFQKKTKKKNKKN